MTLVCSLGNTPIHTLPITGQSGASKAHRYDGSDDHQLVEVLGVENSVMFGAGT
jgi:hypothetical protein